MAITQLILHNFFSFVFIISFIVFIHEFGHFYIARLCGVKVDEFSIGFGKELFFYNDKKGTRWKICLLPFGGYVKMFGDKNGASMPDVAMLDKMSDIEKKQSFIGKNVYHRIAIVAAGPIANFLLTIVIFTFLFKVNGLNKTLPIVNEVLMESAALEAGIKTNDEILSINGKEITDFQEIRTIVSTSIKEDLVFQIKRREEILTIKITPKIQVIKDFFGDDVKVPIIGISAPEAIRQDLNLPQSFIQANKETYNISVAIFKALGELVTGKRSVEDLGGPIKIAKYSGKTVSMGVVAVLWFMAMISLNLGVMNLLPIPVLDGGHLFYYIIEAIRGKALSQKTQQIGFKIGLSLVLALMIFTTVNDVRQLFGS